eukprot:5070755-Prymnesium_polylepis.1
MSDDSMTVVSLWYGEPNAHIAKSTKIAWRFNANARTGRGAPRGGSVPGSPPLIATWREALRDGQL